jgi:tRNA modification GTPase
MYNTNDTIIAVSSPSSEQRVIIRISGPATLEICSQIFEASDSALVPCPSSIVPRPSSLNPRLIAGTVSIDAELKLDAMLYLFFAPHSYTGDDVAEIHLYTNSAVVDALIDNLLKQGLRLAQPGEFTAMAYLSGKLDLSQAEAVNEIIVSSNTYQLAAAEKLLAGRLSQTTEFIGRQILDCLSLIEAGLDFSGEDIEFITTNEAITKISEIKSRLEQLLSDSIGCETVIDLPAVGIAGAPNAGKSSLVNTLLGTDRSIVCEQPKTTRDVLTGQLTLEHCRCVIFDCAGLLTSPENVLDELAQQAAGEALRNSTVVVFCVDVTNRPWSQDFSIRRLFETKILLPVATKCDLLGKSELDSALAKMNELFRADFLPISVKTGEGLDCLRRRIDSYLLPRTSHHDGGPAVTIRHRQAVTQTIEHVTEAIEAIQAGNEEAAAMLLRAAYQTISTIERQHLDEQVLDRIFSQFCIGK